MTRIVVDPITRIEGHLRIEAEIKDGKISKHTVQAPWCASLKKFFVAAGIRVMHGRLWAAFVGLHHRALHGFYPRG